MKGFLKKGTTEILDTLPADFKDGTYYMLFNVLDQNGNALDAGTVATADNVTFVSDNVLVVKELTNFAGRAITVAGNEYDAVFVTPGIKVADGGEVTITAIANKTGNKTELNFVVGEDPVIVSFTMSDPGKTIADGDTDVEIPFEALDEEGNSIKNFVTLAKQKTFNELSFNASEGTLTLKEQKDGTAKLLWSDSADYTTNSATQGWGNSHTTDGINRPVSLTAIVVGGETDNMMISVDDKRRPDAVAAVNINEIYVEGDQIKLANTHSLTTNAGTGEFKFYDQYGEIIGTKWGDDNGFFAADAANWLKGTDFAAKHFGVRVINAGSGKIVHDDTNETDGGIVNTDGDYKQAVLEDTDTILFVTTTDIQSAQTGEGFKFEIVSIDDTKYLSAEDQKAEKWDTVSTTKFFPLTVVDITQVGSFTISDLGTVYIGGFDETGDGVWEGDVAELRDGTADTAGLRKR